MAVSGTRQSETPQSLVTPAFAGFSPAAESGTKAALTTCLTTDRKIFDFSLRRGIMAEIEYPGIAKLVSRLVWEYAVSRSSILFINLKTIEPQGFQGFSKRQKCGSVPILPQF